MFSRPDFINKHPRVMQIQASKWAICGVSNVGRLELERVSLSKPAFEIATPLQLVVADKIVEVFYELFWLFFEIRRFGFGFPAMQFGIVVISKLLDAFREPLCIKVINHCISIGGNAQRVSAKNSGHRRSCLGFFAANGQEGFKFLVGIVGNPIPFGIRFELFPLYSADAALLLEEIIFPLLAPILANRM